MWYKGYSDQRDFQQYIGLTLSRQIRFFNIRTGLQEAQNAYLSANEVWDYAVHSLKDRIQTLLAK